MQSTTPTADQVAELHARLRAALTPTFQTVGEIMRASGVDFLTPAKANWHLVRVQGAEWTIDDGVKWRLETTPDKNDNLTFYLQ